MSIVNQTTASNERHLNIQVKASETTTVEKLRTLSNR